MRAAFWLGAGGGAELDAVGCRGWCCACSASPRNQAPSTVDPTDPQQPRRTAAYNILPVPVSIPLAFLLASTACFAVAAASIVIVKRSPRRPRAAAMESLRLAAVGAGLIAIFRPNWQGAVIPAVIALLTVFWILRKRAGDF